MPSPSAWYFGGPPSRGELVASATAVLAAVTGLLVFVDTIAWGWLVVGAVLAPIVFGPIAWFLGDSALARRVGEWSEPARGLLVLFLLPTGLVFLMIAVDVAAVPPSTSLSLFYGWILAVAGLVGLQFARHHELAG